MLEGSAHAHVWSPGERRPSSRARSTIFLHRQQRHGVGLFPLLRCKISTSCTTGYHCQTKNISLVCLSLPVLGLNSTNTPPSASSNPRTVTSSEHHNRESLDHTKAGAAALITEACRELVKLMATQPETIRPSSRFVNSTQQLVQGLAKTQTHRSREFRRTARWTTTWVPAQKVCFCFWKYVGRQLEVLFPPQVSSC